MNRKKSLLISLTAIVVIAGFFSGSTVTQPHYNCEINPGPHSCHLEGESPRLLERIASYFPEDLQVKSGGAVLNLRQDIISKEENAAAIYLASQVYTEMASKQEWADLPSSLGLSYERFLKLNLDQGQYFVYLPKNRPERVILFLHGFGGNFTSYLYVLSEVAEVTRSVLIAPSYGNGIWDRQSIGFIDSVMEQFISKADLNNLSLSIIGFSNGGLILAEYLQNTSYRFDNIIGLSTYLDPSEYHNNEKLTAKLKDSTFTYIYGDIDERVGLEDSLTSLGYLRDNAVEVNIREIEGNHLIFFERKDLVKSIIISQISFSSASK